MYCNFNAIVVNNLSFSGVRGAMTTVVKDLIKRGTFILLEGMDRSGKTSQVQKLVEFLRGTGHNVAQFRFPDRTTITGQQCDKYLTMAKDGNFADEVAHLLFSANRWEAAEKIQNLIESGTTIVCDRYSYSGIAYSASKGKSTLTLDWCAAPEIGLPAPDVVLYCQVSAEVAAARSGFGQERYEQEETQRRVHQQFQILQQRNNVLRAKGVFAPEWICVDCDKDFDTVHECIKEHALAVMKDTNGPMNRFVEF